MKATPPGSVRRNLPKAPVRKRQSWERSPSCGILSRSAPWAAAGSFCWVSLGPLPQQGNRLKLKPAQMSRAPHPIPESLSRRQFPKSPVLHIWPSLLEFCLCLMPNPLLWYFTKPQHHVHALLQAGALGQMALLLSWGCLSPSA